MREQHIKAKPEQDTGPKSPQIGALVAGKALDKTIQYQREQQQETKLDRPQAEKARHDPGQDTS